MRISTRRGDPGYREGIGGNVASGIRPRYRVTLNDRPVLYPAVTADEELGWVLALHPAASAMPWDRDGNLATISLFGRVRIIDTKAA